MFKLAAKTLIRAQPATVYGIISDIASYADWNPWNVRGEGTAEEGKTIAITAKLGKRQLTVHHRILVAKPNETFIWCDLGWFTRLAYGERARYLEPHRDGVNYRVELTISGPLAWFVRWQMQRDLETGLRAEMEALKRRAELRG
jgi:hypothetical protein